MAKKSKPSIRGSGVGGSREDKNPILYAKIFPPIGIARVGDSPAEYFYGPELNAATPEQYAAQRFKDAEGRIKRQAARFRVYGFDAKGNVVKELTDEDASITWTVELANKKAAWFEFNGAAKARKQFADDQEAERHSQRNAKIGRIVRDEHSGRFVSDGDRKALEINGGARTIAGTNQIPATGDRGNDRRFNGYFKRGIGGNDGHRVYLGELRTDDCGRLVVLGGRGKSDPVGPNGIVEGDDRLNYWIVNYANNDHWHDDVSDGPVTATVVLKSGKALEVRDGAWVVVGPPDFAPDVTNLVTLYDVMEEVAIAARMEVPPGCPELRKVDAVGFHHDILPILSRANDYRWVSPLGLRGHGYGKPGAADAVVLNPDRGQHTAGKDAERARRERFFSMLRVPTYDALDPETGATAVVDAQLASRQSTSFFMPPLSGDEGDRETGETSHWLSLTRLQYSRLRRWKDDEFDRDDPLPDHSSGRPPETHNEPARLTRCALEACVGGAFFPGIEITSIVRDPSLYSEPFRISHAHVGPGDITKYMACPWQADFYECRDAWWPAARPDAVITDLTFDELFKSFEPEKSSGFEAVMFNRERWDRGLEIRPRPFVEYLRRQLFPDPEHDDVGEYANALADAAAGRLLAITPAAAFIGSDGPSGVAAERLISPWRLQFLTQEQLDGYSGRYFVPTVIPPENAIAIAEDIARELGCSNLIDLRRDWNTLRITHTSATAKILIDYASAIRSNLKTYCLDVVEKLPLPAHGADIGITPAQLLRDALRSAPAPEPQSEPQDFDDKSDAYLRLRAAEFVSQLVSRLFLRRSGQAPDMAMVDGWRDLGFVRRRIISPDAAKGIPEIAVQVETERDKYDGRSFRDYFYYLMNIAEFPDFLPYAKKLAERFLESAQVLIDQTSIFDPNHPESFVPYTAENFTAKLEQIYEILRSQAAEPQQYVYPFTRKERINRIRDNAPFNQTDGAWLRYAANAGTTDEVTAMLFEVWSDEVGNGDPSLHHGNLYTALLKSLGVYLPDVSTRAYADDPRLQESTFIGPVFELAISQHTQAYFPEIIGMTLFLEWEVLSLVPGVKRADYYGIDSHFWQMHVGIDNATEGHGAKAKQATEVYLDNVFREGGAVSQQEHWKRIWRGFVAFATSGYDLFSNLSNMSVESESALHPQTAADRVALIIEKKLHYGQLNHLRDKLGVHRINDLFDDPGLFLEELASSSWISPGDPEGSRFMNYLTTFNGPMYKIFSKEDLLAWREWIEWLGKEGDTLKPKRHLTRGESMMLLLAELRQLILASHGHRIYQVPTMRHDDRQMTLIELFESDDLKEIMRGLSDPKNGWIVPFRPAESVLIVDLLKPGRPMGAALDQRIPRLFNQVGRMVVYEWIAAGCPIPGEQIPDPGKTVVPTRRPARLFMQQYGMGAVH